MREAKESIAFHALTENNKNPVRAGGKKGMDGGDETA
jgi:hypothetical protein